MMVVMIAIVILIRPGFSPHNGLLLSGAATSFICLVGYMVLIEGKAESSTQRRSNFLSLLALGGVVPYFFGCHLLFYEGCLESMVASCFF